jgi:hypothetical protein
MVDRRAGSQISGGETVVVRQRERRKARWYSTPVGSTRAKQLHPQHMLWWRGGATWLRIVRALHLDSCRRKCERLAPWLRLAFGLQSAEHQPVPVVAIGLHRTWRHTTPVEVWRMRLRPEIGEHTPEEYLASWLMAGYPALLSDGSPASEAKLPTNLLARQYWDPERRDAMRWRRRLAAKEAEILRADPRMHPTEARWQACEQITEPC